MVLVQKWPFFQLLFFLCNTCQHFGNFFFLGKRDKENVFYDILERKNAFLGYKDEVQKVEKLRFF